MSLDSLHPGVEPAGAPIGFWVLSIRSNPARGDSGGGGCDPGSAAHLAHSSDPSLPAVDSGRAHAGWPDQQYCRSEILGQPQDDSLAARLARYVRVSFDGSGGGHNARREIRFPDYGQLVGLLLGRFLYRLYQQSELEPDDPLPERIRGEGSDVCPQLETSCGLEFRDRVAGS